LGETKRFIEKSLAAWNAHDKVGWTRDVADDCEFATPGGIRGTGRELRDQLFSMWTQAFPNNVIKPSAIAEDGEYGILEAVFHGTQTGTLDAPTGPIPATGKQVSIPFVTTSRIKDGRYKSFHLYFDQVELMVQLGLMPAPVTTSA
jgi:ketosteroid isomerase-like protein